TVDLYCRYPLSSPRQVSAQKAIRDEGSRPKSRNRALSRAVAAREFRERSTLRPTSASLGLLRLGQFRRSAHVLAALLRPAAALGGTGADKVALHVRFGTVEGPTRAQRDLGLPDGRN